MSEVRELMLAWDIFVLTSRFEGLPLVIIEAMFAGLPVVASNVGGISELVIDGRTGFLTDAGWLDDLVEKLLYLINNPKERQRMGEAGRKIAQEEFGVRKMTDKYEKLYLSETK